MSGIYIHIPFCERKCIYCDFYSLAIGDRSDLSQKKIDRYLKSLKQEIAIYGKDAKGVYDTIYFGGGTPSLLEPFVVSEIIKQLKQTFQIASNVEITLETNPGTVDVEKLKLFHAAGINRLSIGAQSFYDEDLEFLGRIHTAKDAMDCFVAASKAGFDNISADLIFNLPFQTKERWIENLKKALEYNVKHLSCYSLIIEPDTPLEEMISEGVVCLPGEESDALFYETAIDFLTENGLRHYEVSNFAFSGFESRHNLNYWKHGNYLGLGPSGHSFDGKRRWWNIKNLDRYCGILEDSKLPIVEEELLSESQLRNEKIFLGLRSEGIDLEQFEKQYKVNFMETYGFKLKHFILEGLINIEKNNLCLTPSGFLLCDEICSTIMK